MSRFSSLTLFTAAAVTSLLSSARAAVTFVYTPVAAPAGTTINFGATSPVSNSIGTGAAIADDSFYISGSGSGTYGLRFDTTGTAQMLGSLGAASGSLASSLADAISPTNIAVGNSSQSASSSSTRATYWVAGSSTPMQLNSINANYAGASTGVANGINAAGLIVGQSQLYTADGYTGLGTRPVYWTVGSPLPTELGSLGTNNTTDGTTDDIAGVTTAAANAINSAGVMVGYATNYNSSSPAYGSNDLHATLWRPLTGSNAATDLGVLSTSNGMATGNGTSTATAINTAGTVVGSSTLYDTARYSGSTTYNLGTRAVRWASGSTTPVQLQPLNTQGADIVMSYSISYKGTSTSTANAINATGTAVGSSELYNNTPATPVDLGTRAVYWAANSPTAVQLGLLPYSASSGGFVVGAADAINTVGLIAGYEDVYNTVSTGISHAVVWTADGTAYDLNTAFSGTIGGLLLNSATSISDTDLVTGLATSSTGATEAYILDVSSLVSVPEPTTLTVLGLLVPSLLIRRRRRHLGASIS